HREGRPFDPVRAYQFDRKVNEAGPVEGRDGGVAPAMALGTSALRARINPSSQFQNQRGARGDRYSRCLDRWRESWPINRVPGATRRAAWTTGEDRSAL